MCSKLVLLMDIFASVDYLTQVFIFTLYIYWNFSHLINFSCRTSGVLPFACIYIMLFLNRKQNEVLNEVVVNTNDKNSISFTFSYCNVTSKVHLVIISCYVFFVMEKPCLKADMFLEKPLRLNDYFTDYSLFITLKCLF